jgi:hypothetical protein
MNRRLPASHLGIGLVGALCALAPVVLVLLAAGLGAVPTTGAGHTPGAGAGGASKAPLDRAYGGVLALALVPQALAGRPPLETAVEPARALPPGGPSSLAASLPLRI